MGTYAINLNQWANMSSENNNNGAQKSNLNKYIYIFLGFIAIIALAFFIIRSGNNDMLAKKPVEEPKNEQVVVTKDPNLAQKKQKLLKDTSGDFYLGEQYAPVVMIEYASLACPHCRDFHEHVVEPLIANYVNKGKVKYVFRDFPHMPSAFSAATLAHCADSDKYFSFVKVLFKSQDQWAFDENYVPILKNIGKLGGVSEAKFDQCLADKALENKLLQSIKDASDILEVHSVPTIFINGTPYEGKREYKDVAAAIDLQLKGE